MSRAIQQPMAGRVASRVASWTSAIARKRGRLLVGGAFAALTLTGCVLFARHLTHTSWPLQRAHMGLVALAGGLYFASFILRALGWQKLFPARARPDRARCLAACGAAAASGAVLPFRLDYRVKFAQPPPAADPGRSLWRRRLRRARSRPTAEPAPMRSPARAPAQGG